MQKRDVSWLKYILKDEQSGYKSKIDFCTMSILIHGVHTLEALEPCCANCNCTDETACKTFKAKN